VSWQTESGGGFLSIAQVREKTGVSARTLRYYEELGLLPGARPRVGGRGVYGTDSSGRMG
jgi:DNA-binding transcriptional MerR regulator